MYERGERCVVLVDEAHAMPLETLEELRLLYNLQVGKHKLIQIVLFGQPELDEKLEQSNMRQLKDRIVHHFSILPISRKVIDSYLMFRMRAAGYKGPDVFSPAAVLLIGKASQGLMRRVNILADKALLAAFVENTHNIEVRHVQAAIRDSEMTSARNWFGRKSIATAGGVTLFAATLAGAGWFVGHEEASRPAQTETRPISMPQPTPASAVAEVVAPQPAASEVAAASAAPAPVASEVAAATVEKAAPASVAAKPSAPPASAASAPAPAAEPQTVLLQRRLAATQKMLAAPNRGNVSIQLFYTDGVRPERMEGFLGRARKLGKLAEIYIVPIKLNGKDGYRVLYGLYGDSAAARAGMLALPQRYKDAFAPTLHMLDDSQNPS
jgi:hypothetical protein